MLWRNPIFIRFCRSQLRVKKAIFWYCLVLIASAFTTAIIYVPQVVQGIEPKNAAQAALVPILIIQGVVLLFLGTGSVASGITREKVENVLNYQRLTPLPIHQKILGYLFGLPVREYVLFAITLPFLIFILIVGRIPMSAFGPYYLIFFTSTILYHFTGMVAGMISKRWRWSARISQGLIILLYFVLPNLSHIGLVFLEFLTVRPVFVEKILPLVAANTEMEMSGIGFMAGHSVPFFTTLISGSVFSFLIQSLLILLFTMIIARKWRADTVPAISKAMAVGTFLGFSILSLANIWPNLTRSENALNIFQSHGDLAKEVAVSVLPLILAITSTMLAFVLMTSALTDPMQYRHGQIKARRLNLIKLSPWDDASSGYLMTSLLCLIQVSLIGIATTTIYYAGYFEGMEAGPFRILILMTSCILFMFYFQGLKENFGGGPLALFALLHWLLPVLVAILIIAISRDLLGTTLLVAALSPLPMIPFSVVMLVPDEEVAQVLPEIQRALGFGFIVLTGLNIWLHGRLRAQRKSATTVLP